MGDLGCMPMLQGHVNPMANINVLRRPGSAFYAESWWHYKQASEEVETHGVDPTT